MAYNFVTTEILECCTNRPELAQKFTACLQRWSKIIVVTPLKTTVRYGLPSTGNRKPCSKVR